MDHLKTKIEAGGGHLTMQNLHHPPPPLDSEGGCGGRAQQ